MKKLTSITLVAALTMAAPIGASAQYQHYHPWQAPNTSQSEQGFVNRHYNATVEDAARTSQQLQRLDDRSYTGTMSHPGS